MLSEVLLASETWSTLRDNQILYASRQCWNAVHTVVCNADTRSTQSASVTPSSFVLAAQLCDCDKFGKIPNHWLMSLSSFNPKAVILVQKRPFDNGIADSETPSRNTF